MTRTPIALALCLSLLGGCSFAFSRSPRRSPITNEPPPCGPLYVAPVIDATQAAGGLFVTMALLSEGSNHESEMDTMGLLAGIALAQTGVYLASAIYGAQHVKACKRMYLEQQPLPPPPVAEWPPEVEQTVDADESQIDIHTTIRRAPPPPQ